MTDQNDHNPSEDELIDAALAALDQEPLPTSTLPEPGEPPTAVHQESEQGSAQEFKPPSPSPTLDALDKSRRPKAETVCERCPASVWFASPEEVKCYCRVMYLVVWSSQEPNQILLCDGEFLGQDQE